MATTALDAVRQLFESTKNVCAAIERRLGARQDSTDALLVDAITRIEALETQLREREKLRRVS